MPQKLYIYYNFSRQEIEANAPADFLEIFSPSNVPDLALRHLSHAIEFRVGGYRREKREPFLVPEIRVFFRELNCRLNYALAFYSETDSSFLSFLANCHMDHLVVAQHQSWARVALKYQLDELDRFIEEGCDAIQRLGSRAGIDARGITLRQKKFAGYFEQRLGWQAKD